MMVAVAGSHTYTDSALSSGSVMKSASGDRSVVMMGLGSDSTVGSGIDLVKPGMVECTRRAVGGVSKERQVEKVPCVILEGVIPLLQQEEANWGHVYSF